MAAALAIWLNKTGRINGTLAIETWAEEVPQGCQDEGDWFAAAAADCGDITLGGTGGNFARVWIISSATALGLISFIIVPFVWCNKPSRTMMGTEDDSSMKPRSTVKSVDDIRRTEPDLASARRHLVSSSATVGGKWLNPFCTDIDGFSAIGGSGLEMYFTTLRTLGILFATMAALTFPTSAFCLLGTFAPDNGQFLAAWVARASIGNLGLLADLYQQDSKVLDPLLRIVRAGCDGAELSDLTPIFAWLDLASMCFIEIPRRALTDDLENVSVQDFSVVIDKLPPRKNHLEERMRVVQAGKPGMLGYSEIGSRRQENPSTVASDPRPEPHVADITLVRDYGGRLESLKARGHMLQSIDVAKAYGKEKAIFKAEGRLAKLDKRLEAQLEPDNELPVLRAYVILNRTADKHGLMYDYRLANFALFRCCQSSSKRFFGAALRVREAPQPSDLLWENQDTPWWSRLLRQLCMFVTFIIILAISLALIYVTTVYGKREAGVQLSSLSASQVSTAANWTKDFAESEGGNILNCWCESQGYAKLVEDTSLVTTCTPWFLKTARGIGIMTAASCVVVLINLVLQYVLIAMAYFERPLSLTNLNKSMMTKIFLAQTLNTGFVLFIVNTYGPDGMRDVLKAIPLIGTWLFAGPFADLTRAWYVVVGATIMVNMLLNMVVPPAVTIANMFVTWLLRRCCRGRVKHHSELIAYYTNPDFDIKLKYAQMLTTVFVALTYSAGMPLLYLFAFGYMFFMYWADKVALLWCSKRPPFYDALLPKESSEKLLYAIALHCVFAILMYGQPCVFPSNPVGGDIGKLIAEGESAAGEHLQGWWPRLTKESTWMFVAWLSFMLALWVMWWLVWAFQETIGTFGTLLWQLCCASKKVEDADTIAAIQRGESVDSIRQKTGKTVDIAATMTWPEAAEIIDRCSPPSTYHMEDHPDMLEIAHLMKAEYTRGSEVNPEGGELPVPQHPGDSFSAAMTK
ncbi:unnamed protein product [Symbiodinium microadriaticum]|nr:unnamed protein product [Symbiodinium microadriaticum]